MKKQDDFKKWIGRISLAKKRAEKRKEEWNTAKKLYENDLDKDSCKIRKPFLFSVFSTMLPTLFSQMPELSIKSKEIEDTGISQFVQTIIKEEYESMNLYEEIKKVVLSAIIYSTGFMKIGVSSDFEQVEEPIDRDGFIKNFLEREPYGPEDEESFNRYKADEKNYTISEEKVTKEGLWADYIRPHDILFDTEADSLESCSFVAHRVIMNKKAFEERFGKIDIDRNYIERAYDNDEMTSGDRSEYDDDEDSNRYEIFEIWSKETEEILVLCFGHDEFLEKRKWPYDNLKSYPFECLVLADKLDDIYGINEVLLHKDEAEVINNLVSIQEDSAERSNGGVMYEKGAVDEDQLEVLLEPGHKKVMEVHDMSRVREWRSSDVSREVINLQAAMETSIQESAHVSKQTMQSAEQSKQTATEIRARQAAGDAMNQFKIRQIERFIERLTRKMIALMREFYTLPRMTTVSSGFGVSVYKEWTGEDIGEHTLSVKSGSAAFQDEAIVLDGLLQFLELASKLPIPNKLPIIESIVKKVAGIKNIDPEVVAKAFEAPPPPPTQPPQQGGPQGGPLGGPPPPSGPQQQGGPPQMPQALPPMANLPQI